MSTSSPYITVFRSGLINILLMPGLWIYYCSCLSLCFPLLFSNLLQIFVSMGLEFLLVFYLLKWNRKLLKRIEKPSFVRDSAPKLAEAAWPGFFRCGSISSIEAWLSVTESHNILKNQWKNPMKKSNEKV